MKRSGALTLFILTLAIVIIPFWLWAQDQPHPFTGPVSKYYLQGIYVVQGPRVVATIPMVYGDKFGSWEGAFAVSETIRTRASDARDYPIGRAGEYTLDGIPTGHSYFTPPTGNLRYYDGTTDGVHNYFVDHGQGDPLLGGVWIADYYWQNARWFFYPKEICYVPEEGGCGGLSGIAYDPTNNSLWISARGNPVIGDYSLEGVLLSSFDTGMEQPVYLAGLGVDPADHTLWTTDLSHGLLRQYSLDGGTAGQLLQAGIPEGLPSVGSDAGEFQILGCASPLPGTGGGCLTPDRLSFGKQVLGTTSNARSVKLVNTGTEPLAISNIIASGEFTQTNNCPMAPKPLARGEFCTLKVSFTPTTINKRTGVMAVIYQQSASTQQAPLSGIGTVVTLLPPNLNFGPVRVGQQSNPMTAVLTNKSNTAAVNITNITITGGGKTDFSILSNTCAGSISPLGTCDVTLVFNPTLWNKRGATLNIFHDGGGSLSMVSMVGTGQ